MSLNWYWSEKCGEATLEQEWGDGKLHTFPLSLYKGNAYMIFLNEWEENGVEKYSVWDFWADRDHAKNCLGLNKKMGYTENRYARGTDHLTKFRINKAKYPHTKDLVTMLAYAFDNLTIEIYSDPEEGKSKWSEYEVGFHCT